VKKAGVSRKVRAGITAAILAAAIALTGTLAWQSFSQVTVNEFFENRNPGGRVHDDFNGVENKDVYAENFTDADHGAPVLVRIRLEEYMEMGEDAGVKRTTTDSGGNVITDPSRKATPLIPGADINDTDTWYIHKPDSDTVKDPFHEYWKWDQDGSTLYMPTFNKNKDSLSVDVNGTYVGPDKIFNEDDPYDDYHKYTPGETKTADAYYDADGDDVDEYNPVANPAEVPGAGGLKKGDPGVTDPDYQAINETHTAQSTLNGLGYITMADWVAAGKPVCNKWVWDTDGWFYWPEPLMPQTATGLLLDKVTEIKSPGEKAYYAINIVGQFVDFHSIGEDKVTDTDGTVTKPATGFFVDGVSDAALDLLHQATQVEVVEHADGTEHWYLPMGHNIHKEILDDEGTLSEPICAGEDETIGTADDRTDVVYVEAGLTVNGTDYGNWFLAPRPNVPYEEPWYRAVGEDGQLGTWDDDHLWLTDGTFPTGTVVDKVADAVTITPPADATVVGGRVEYEFGMTLDPFTAQVTLDGAPIANQDVRWSVAAAGGGALQPGTTISSSGVLTVDDNEPARDLVITAVSKLDDQVVGHYTVAVKQSLVVVVKNGGEAKLSYDFTKAGKNAELELEAVIMNAADGNHSSQDVTWTVKDESGNDIIGVTIGNAGILTANKFIDYGTKVVVRATSNTDPGMFGEMTVVVGNDPIEIDGREITLDGIKYIVLVENKTANKALIMQKDILEIREMASTANFDWTRTTLFRYINDTSTGWLADRPNLCAILTTGTNGFAQREDYNSTPDKYVIPAKRVSLLSEADVFGTFNDGPAVVWDFTVCAQLVWKAGTGGSWRGTYSGASQWWWLRSPYQDSNSAAAVAGNSTLIGKERDGSAGQGGVRPVCWIDTTYFPLPSV